MIRESTKYLIEKAINDELQFTLHRKPLFHSDHEAYAVLLEEWDELEEEIDHAAMCIDYLWTWIKEEDPDEILAWKQDMHHAIKDLIAEAVQVAAMLEKFSVREGEKNE